jgi:hypothetical protein
MSRRALRRWVACGLLLALAGAGWWYWLEHRPGSGITAENAARIEPGMTAADVEAILGCPAGVYSTMQQRLRSRCSLKQLSLDPPGTPRVYWREWLGASGTVLVLFDSEDDSVVRHTYDEPIEVAFEDWVDCLLAITGLR